ncbi:hypothetical protein BJ165DRAFT_265776 [Panaeolus papilionaceus]|nr:hypothetical protein BJ165DRAFT_265776 [Panaeolus papilionaceus]
MGVIIRSYHLLAGIWGFSLFGAVFQHNWRCCLPRSCSSCTVLCHCHCPVSLQMRAVPLYSTMRTPCPVSSSPSRRLFPSSVVFQNGRDSFDVFLMWSWMDGRRFRTPDWSFFRCVGSGGCGLCSCGRKYCEDLTCFFSRRCHHPIPRPALLIFLMWVGMGW